MPNYNPQSNMDKTVKMTPTQFKRWMKNKQAYTIMSYSSNGVYKKTLTEVMLITKSKFFTSIDYIFPKSVKLKPYGLNSSGNMEYQKETINGKPYYNIKGWKASYNKANKLVYVTEN